MPLAISDSRVGPICCEDFPKALAMSPVRWGHAPSRPGRLSAAPTATPRPEEIPVQTLDCGIARFRDVAFGDGGGRRRIPGLVSPFLKEIGVALGLANHRGDRLIVEFDIHLRGGLDQGASRLGGVQSSDIRIFEETLG